MTRLYFEDKYYEKYNLFLFTKIRQTGYSEIGIGLIDAKSNIKNVNEKMEDYLKRIVKLRIFS
jgi:methionine synthase II (cobalamin-independent)